MAERASHAHPDAGGNYNFHIQERTQIGITPERIDDCISTLPSPAIDNCRRTHEKCFNPIVASSSFRQPFTPSRSPSPPPDQPRWKRRPWARYIEKYKKLCLRRGRSPRTYAETFLRNIDLAIIDGNRERPIVHAEAMLDFWCDYNVTSRKFGNLIFSNLDSATPYTLLDTLGGMARAVKTFDARWHFLDDPNIVNPCLRFDHTMEVSEFHIMEHASRFDVIIGRQDIMRLDLLDIEKRPPLAAPNFRSLIDPVNLTTAKSLEDAAARERELEEEERKRDIKYEQRRTDYARNEAHHFAVAYANEQARRYGPDAYAPAYDKHFDYRFKKAVEDYTKRHPRC